MDNQEKNTAESQPKNPHHLAWQFKEFVVHERGRSWYLIAGVIGTAIVIQSILTHNWLFALIVIMIAMVMVINHRVGPRDVSITIHGDGIDLGQVKYTFSDLDKFWIIYRPPHIKSLYITFKSPLRPRLTVPLEDQNPIEVRALLREFVAEDLEQETEPFSDAFGRIMKM